MTIQHKTDSKNALKTDDLKFSNCHFKRVNLQCYDHNAVVFLFICESSYCFSAF